MGTIAKLVVALSANSAKLVSELRKSKKSVGSWAESVRAKTNTVAKVLAATGAAAAGAIVAIVNRQAAEIDRLAKTAAKLNIDTGELQKLRFQAELTGVSVGTLDTSLQRMVRRVSEAANGTGEAKDAIKELGLDASALAQLSPEQQFNAIAEAMKGISNQGDRVRLAMKLFDTEGVALVNTLTSNLQATGAEFDKLGIRITNQQAAMVEAYNDSKTKLGTLWDGFLNQITVAVAPAFQAVVDYVTRVTMDMGGMGKVAEAVVSSIATGIGFVADVTRGWQIIIKGVQAAFGTLAQYALQSLGWVYDKYADLRELMDEDFKRTDFFEGMADAFSFQTQKVEKDLQELLNKERPSVAIKAKIAEFQASAQKAAAGAESQQRLAKATDKSAASLTSFGKAVEKHASGMSDLSKKLFGESGENKGPKARQVRDINFEMYAKAAKAAKDRGDSGEFNRLIGLANNQASLSKASAFNYDQAGQRDVLNRLTGGNAEKIGTIEFKVGDKAVSLQGNPSQIKSFTEQLKTVLGNEASEVGVKAS